MIMIFIFIGVLLLFFFKLEVNEKTFGGKMDWEQSEKADELWQMRPRHGAYRVIAILTDTRSEGRAP